MSTRPDAEPRLVLARDRSLGELLDEAFGLYRRHLLLFVLLAAGVVVPVDLIVSGIGLGQLTSGYDSSPDVGTQLVPAVVSALVTVPLITAMNVRAVVAIADGHPPSPGQAAREGLDLFTPVLVAVLLASAGIMLGILALIVPGIILAVHWSVVAQVVTVEGERGPAALRRSWDLVRGDAWWVLGVLLVTNIIASLLAGIVTLPAAAGAESADSALIMLLATMVAEIFTLSFLAIAMTLLFFTLRARKAGIAREVPAPWSSPAGPSGEDRPSGDPGLAHPERVPPVTPPADLPAPPAPPAGWEPPRPGA